MLDGEVDCANVKDTVTSINKSLPTNLQPKYQFDESLRSRGIEKFSNSNFDRTEIVEKIESPFKNNSSQNSIPELMIPVNEMKNNTTPNIFSNVFKALEINPSK